MFGAEIRANAWKIATAGAAAVALGLGITAVVLASQKSGLETDLATARGEITRINADLNTCNGNVGQLELSIDGQNRRIATLGRESAERVAQAERDVEAARQATVAAQSRLNVLLRAPARGATVCERIEEVDRAVLESLP